MRDTLKNIIYIARHFKLATALNVIGLIVAFATFYLLMTQVIYQAGFNHGVKDYERMYRMESDFVFEEWNFSDLVCRPFVEALKRVPQVESYALIADVSSDYTLPFQKGDTTLNYMYTQCSRTAVSALSSCIDGNIEWNDTVQEGIIIPEKMAIEYFETPKATGKEMLYQLVDQNGNIETIPLMVRGVYKDFPENSELLNCIYGFLQDDDNIYSLNGVFKCFIKFKQVPEDLDAIEQSIKQAIIAEIDSTGWENYSAEQDIPWTKQTINKLTIHLSPLKSSYFEHSSYTSSKSGFRSMFIILQLVCLLVIILANINFLNFTLAEAPMRIRGINTRRTLGASRSSLRHGIIGECVITAVAACLVALILCYLLTLLPATRILTDGDISLRTHWPLIIAMLVIAVVVGIVAGNYPATCATAFNPAMALTGKTGLTPKGKILRTFLVFLQLVVSMVVIIYSATLFLQSYYIFNSPCGYDKNRILVTTLPAMEDSIHQQFYNELKMMPDIKAIAYSDVTLGSSDRNNFIKTPIQGELVNYRYIHVSPNYLRTMGIKVIEGRDFLESDSAAIIINKSAQEQWNGLKLGTKVSTGLGNALDSAVIVGVCPDIRYASTRIGNDRAFFFILNKSKPCRHLNVRIAKDANIKNTITLIDNLLLKHYGDTSIKMDYYDNALRDAYDHEFRYIWLIFIISFICLLITLVGMFCLAIFEREYRRKEIGIRKVVGASTSEIIKMLCMRYIWLILGSFFIAAPIAYYSGRMTLRHFKEHTPIHWWLFPLGLLFVGGVALTTVAVQSWRTARKNPAESIKTE